MPALSEPTPDVACLLFLPFTYSGGGVPEIGATIASGMVAAGLHVEAFLPRARRPLPGNITSRQTLPIPLRYGRWKHVWRPALWTLEWSFRRAVKRADPARTVAYFWPSPNHAPSIGLLEYTKSRGIPIVREMVNCAASTGRPIMDEVYARHRHPGHHNLSDELVAYEAVELPVYDHIFAPSSEVARSLREMEIPDERILDSSYGWRRSRLERTGEVAPRLEHGLRAVFLGIVGLRKGVPELLAAWEEAGIDGELILVGDLDPALEPLIATATATGRVRHLGFTDDVGALLRSADLFLFPTYEEGAPQVVYEASACGLPIVTTPMGMANIVEDGVTGIVVPAGDVTALADAIRRLADDPELRRKLGTAARQAADRFEYAEVALRRGEVLRRIALRQALTA